MSMSMVLNLSPQANELQYKFIKKFNQTWGLKESVIELNIQIGHLSQSLINQGLIKNVLPWNQPNRCLNNISDELCDCFLSVCSIYNFFAIKNSEIKTINAKKYESYTEAMIDLFNLSAQLQDSCMICLNIKPNLNRDERAQFLFIYFNIVEILSFLADTLQIDIETEFSTMIESALDFLNNERC